jgi:serine/threonine protein kinase/tetratricopeptide (TPR) repeat protein
MTRARVASKAGPGGADPLYMDSGDSLGPRMRSVAGSERSRRGLALARVRRELLDRTVEVTHVGRFALLEHLGTGGFGTVYAAYDPMLDRKVALKLLRADARDRALLDEARALAKLAHPNVVTVHEVVELDDRIVLVMGLVNGSRLDAWVRDRSAAQIVAAFVEAGRGLAAAHARGLVHRDVKPQNILVGEDGVARIADFGLARLAPEQLDTDDDAAPSTTHGAGTPKYWAPEIRAKQPATRASDQYAFCLSLQELLGDAPVSRGVQRALARGLARDPSERWPSMDALLEVLDRRPLPRGRLALVGGVVLVAAGAPWGVEAISRHRAVQQCRDEAATIDDADADAVRRAFTSTGLHYAEETWARVQTRLEAYPPAWRTAYEHACTVARVDGHRSETAYAQTKSCFEERKQAFASLVDVLAHADAETVRHAVPAAFDLPDVAQCEDEAWLQRHALPEDPALAEAVLQVRVDLQRAAWARITRDPDAALASVLALRERAAAWEPALAEVELELGAVHLDRGELDEAETALVSAYRRAGAAGLDHVAADAALALASATAGELAQPEQALIWTESAEMLLDRLDDRGRRRGRLADAKASAHRRMGDLDEARSFAEQALAAYQKAPDATDVALARALGSMAVMHVDAGELDLAAELMRESIAIKERALGPNHPSVNDTLLNLGALELLRGSHALALRYHERALANALPFGERHPTVLGILANLAMIHLRLGHHDRALGLARDVVDARTDVLGAAHPDTITALNNLGAVCVEAGRYGEAEALFVDLLDRQRALTTPAPLEVARTLHNLAAVAVELGEPERARDRFVEANELLGRELADDHPEVLRTREGLAVAQLDLGHDDAAAALLEPLLEQRRRTLAPTDPEIATTLRNLGLVAMHREQLERAAGLLSEAEAIHRANASESKDAAALLHDLADVEQRLQHPAQAIGHYERALAIRTRVLGENHADTLATRDALETIRSR